jgi:N-acetylmuramoyl-L-alanine amidase
MSKLIALSDGHGQETLGKRTPIFPDGMIDKETGLNFMHENTFNRAVINYLDVELKRCGFQTLKVAPTDDDTPLKARSDLAKAKGADLYVSVHANASDSRFDGKGKDASGYEIFTKTDNGKSMELAKDVLEFIGQGTPQKNRGIKDGMHLHEIRVNHNHGINAILVECAFMDDLDEAKLLLTDAFRRECATEIAKGVCKFYGVHYVEAPKEVVNPVAKPVEPKVETKPEVKPAPANPEVKPEVNPVKLGQATLLGDLKIHESADLDSKVVGIASHGQVVDVFKESNKMFMIAPNRWISSSTKYVKAPFRDGYGTVEVITGALNVRKANDFDAPIARTLKKGDRVKVQYVKNGMYYLGNGEWISAKSDYTKKI